MYYKFKQMFLYFQRMIQYIRHGGVVYANVTQVQRGNVLKGKRVLITGGTSGIGFAIAQKFVSEGAIVAITGRNKEKLQKAVEQLAPNAIGLEWDVADVAIVPQKVKNAVEQLGGIDILVNNAGAYSTVPFKAVVPEEWDRIFDTNLKGVFFLTQEVIYSEMIPKKRGKILNISSIGGLRGDLSPYAISKWGINALTMALARSFTGQNILVNAIAPGLTPSDMSGIKSTDNLYSASPERDKRIALVEEMSELAMFLVSDAANHIVGQIIPCDGGGLVK